MEHVRAGRPGLVQIKVNSLVDEELIDSLYQASRVGVRVDLVVRGICTLRPGVPGLSDNITVRSVLGRFLEHSRIVRFGDGAGDGSGLDGSGEYWIGSADMMHRNLDRRVEALVRVTDPAARVELQRVLDLSMDPKTAAFELEPDGSWTRRTAGDGITLVHPQDALLRRIVHRTQQAARSNSGHPQ
jgi:polyphosphate kinase